MYERKTIICRVKPELAKAFKKLCLINDTSMQDVLEEFIQLTVDNVEHTKPQ